MPKIVNPRYKTFKETGMIDIISVEQFTQQLDSVDYQNPTKTKQGKMLAILAFYSGLRPVELVKTKPGDFELHGKYVKLKFCANKKGRFSTAWLPLQNPHIKELWTYVSSGLPNFPVFYLFASNADNNVKYKVKSTGEIRTKKYKRTANRVQYLFNHFFGLPPYFFRHNAFSALANSGATDRQLMQAKGAASWNSIAPYIHQSAEQGIKLAKLQLKR